MPTWLLSYPEMLSKSTFMAVQHALRQPNHAPVILPILPLVRQLSSAANTRRPSDPASAPAVSRSTSLFRCLNRSASYGVRASSSLAAARGLYAASDQHRVLLAPYRSFHATARADSAILVACLSVAAAAAVGSYAMRAYESYQASQPKVEDGEASSDGDTSSSNSSNKTSSAEAGKAGSGDSNNAGSTEGDARPGATALNSKATWYAKRFYKVRPGGALCS